MTIEMPAFVLPCGAPECEEPANYMFLHAECSGADPVCTKHHGTTATWLSNILSGPEAVFHLACNRPISPANYSYRKT